jgi:sporulation protein YlmC with PRC-barrel domain
MRALLASGLAATLLLAPSTGYLQTARAETFVTVQPAGQWLASQFIGQSVTNQAGERIGDINDLLFGKDGKIANVVIGVGGFLGIGAKNVAVPYESLSIASDANGKRVITIALSKERLQAAPDFKPTETTVYMRAREQAGKLGREAIDKTKELTGEASKKIEDMRK